MATIKERLIKWKETRSVWQKVTDILFWLLLILLIVPGPRKIIATGVNKVFLQVKTPGLENEENQEMISDLDYGWVLAWDQNEPFYFSNTRDEVVFLNFWATWCPPCRAELPLLQEYYKKLHKKGFDIIGISLDSKEEKLKEFLKEKKLPWRIAFSGLGWEDKTSGLYGVISIPSYWLIDKKGNLRYFGLREEALKKSVEKLLKE
ncbi:MAG: TlpA family protein disulfide reductase [Bacteroidales bacterium]|nr:TlpA family protein disulfide reductase [Bacteroidales bacterium]